MTQRVYNFSPGPAALPLPVLEEAQSNLLALPGEGASVLEISHRSKAYLAIQQDAQDRLRRLLSIPDNYRVLFLQGGARLQFSMVPANLLRGQELPARYVVTGSWSVKAVGEARREGSVEVAFDGKAENYDRLPSASEMPAGDDAAYVYYCSNETIQGVQFQETPTTTAPLVCDASSDFLCRPLPLERFGLIYACAQKNAGPAGVTVVILRDDLLERSRDELPGYLNYRNHAEADSAWNTPPVFAVYLLGLVAKWLEEEIGGLDSMLDLNRRKAGLLYEAIDSSDGFYRGHAQPECRSLMNVTFRLPSEELEQAFVAAAAKQQLASLKGHRSVGGIRASIYNAMPLAGVERLAEFMQAFRRQH